MPKADGASAANTHVTPDRRLALLRALAYAGLPAQQDDVRTRLGRSLTADELLAVYLDNPFLRVRPEELEALEASYPGEPLPALVRLREAARRASAPRMAVFCMPKSGSSFVQSALRAALELPLVSLTSMTSPRQSSLFGMNSREQELDELAVMRNIFNRPSGFVAQHHTRCSVFLALQLQEYGITPILTLRSLFDCIVSFDDMVMADPSADRTRPWYYDSPFALPRGYRTTPDAATRYGILAASLGPWLVNFALSWRRCEAAGVVAPIRLHYDQDIRDPDRFAARLTQALGLTAEQSRRLAAYARDPDLEESRFNQGVSGRGRRLLPKALQNRLEDYVSAFAGELSGADLAILTA